MNTLIRSCLLHALALFAGICLASALAAAASTPSYLITNDDATNLSFSLNSVTFFPINANGSLGAGQQVATGGGGISGGYFPTNRIVVLNASGNQCVFASDASTSDIAAISITTLAVTGNFKGSSTDTGVSNGIGLAMNSQYLYASFTDSSNIGTFQILPSCGLSFVSDVTVGGLQSGIVDGMAVHGNIMVVTYGDGSIESFDLSSGVPVSNGDKQNSTGSQGGSSYPSGIDITQDAHFAIFGDTSTSMLVEVSDISSGKLTPTVVYKSTASINSSNVMLSPDESLLYISNTQGDQISAAFFDKTTGKLTQGCSSGGIKGESSAWSYLASMAFPSTTGTGGGVYVAEFGVPSSIAEVEVSSANGKCTMAEAPGSPVSDPNSPGLLSIAAFPPRAF